MDKSTSTNQFISDTKLITVTKKPSKFYFCPECNEIPELFIVGSDLIFVCSNNHKLKLSDENISNAYKRMTREDENILICSLCGEKIFEDVEYFTRSGKLTYCAKCAQYNLNSSPRPINDKNSYNFCNKHGQEYSFYCYEHRKNCCKFCGKNHENCKKVAFDDIIPSDESIKGYQNNINQILIANENYCNKLNGTEYKITEILLKIQAVEAFSRFSETIINAYEAIRSNYYVIKNVVTLLKYENIFSRKIGKKEVSHLYYDEETPTPKDNDSSNGGWLKFILLAASFIILAAVAATFIILYIKERKKKKDFQKISEDLKKIIEENNSLKTDNEQIIELSVLITSINSGNKDYEQSNKNTNINLLSREFIPFISTPSDFKMFVDGQELTPMLSYYFQTEGLHTITYKFNKTLTDLSNMFKDCIFLRTINFKNFNTSLVTDMSEMFSDCYNLLGLDLTGFDTHAVRDMTNMFKNCVNIKYITNQFDTSSAWHMIGMFMNCSALETVNMATWNTNSVLQVNDMFLNDYSLNYLDMYNLNFPNCVSFINFFKGCRNLKIKISDGEYSRLLFANTTHDTGIDDVRRVYY